VRVVVDTGPLYAVADSDDADHERCLHLLTGRRADLVIPALVVAEATYLVGTRLGAVAEARFLRGLEPFDIEAPLPEDWERIAELVERYGSFPLGGTDASVVALAERLKTPVVATLDRRHFAAVRPRHCRAFHILP
jgi:predicted nucleic acid-binding protein